MTMVDGSSFAAEYEYKYIYRMHYSFSFAEFTPI